MNRTLALNTRFKFWKRYENGISGSYQPEGILKKIRGKFLGNRVVRATGSSVAAGRGSEGRCGGRGGYFTSVFAGVLRRLYCLAGGVLGDQGQLRPADHEVQPLLF